MFRYLPDGFLLIESYLRFVFILRKERLYLNIIRNFVGRVHLTGAATPTQRPKGGGEPNDIFIFPGTRGNCLRSRGC